MGTYGQGLRITFCVGTSPPGFLDCHSMHGFDRTTLPHRGSLGKELCATFFDMGWVKRIRETRAVRLTDSGQAILARAGFHLEVAT